MTTIGNYSVAIGLAADGLIQGGILARKELASLNTAFRSVVDPSERLAKQLNAVETALAKGAISKDTAAQVTERLRSKIQALTTETNAHTEAQRKDNQLIAEGERLTRSLMTSEERHAAQLRQLKTLYEAQAIGLTTYKRAVEQADATLKASAMASGTVIDAAKPVTGMALLSSKLAGPIAALASFRAVTNLATDSLAKFGEIEKATTAFEVLTGSAAKANSLLAETRQLAARGISMSALNQSAATMLSFNVSMEDTIPTLRSIAEITRGDTERIKLMSLAFAQAGAAGRLMGQDLLQMINAGFNPLQEISRKTGRSLIDLRKDMEGGLISFAMVKDAFASATAEGGKFNGMMDKMAETTAGATMQMQSRLENLKISLGEALAPLAKEGIANLDPFIAKAKETIDSIAGISTALTNLKANFADIKNLGGDFFRNFKAELPELNKLLKGPEMLDKAFKNLGLPNTENLKALPGRLFTMNPLTMMQNAGIASDRMNAMTKDSEKRIEALQRLAAKGMATESEMAELATREANARLRANVTARMELVDKLQAQQEQLAKQPTVEPKAKSALEKEAEATDKRYKTMLDSLTVQLEKLREGKAAATGLKAEMSGFNPLQQQAISGIAQQIEAIEKRNKAEKERLVIQNEQLRAQDQMQKAIQRDADQLREKFQTPAEKLARTFAEINRLRQLNAISPFEADRAMKEAAKDTVKDMKIDSPQSKEIGSQQAADWLANWRNQGIGQKAKENQEVINKLAAQVAAQQETNRKLDKLVDVQPRNRR